MSSGDEIEAGRVTTAESTTDLLGAIPSEQDVDFNGMVILRVAPQPGDLKPNITLDGIHGVGTNGGGFSGAPPGGAGVVGFGGPNNGTGVVGRGGGVGGTAGTGVNGIGGDGNDRLTSPPGVGVLAQGGRMLDNRNTLRLPHGAGVIAIAGGGGLPLPPAKDTGGVGVFAQGADSNESTIIDDGVVKISGPPGPGSGVLGRGGVKLPPPGSTAAGVIGLAGDVTLSAMSGSADTGVFGQGNVGPGIRGLSRLDRGAILSSDQGPQMRLIPLEIPDPTKLSVNEMAGDLLVTTTKDERGTRVATLWFCKSNVAGKPGLGNWIKIA